MEKLKKYLKNEFKKKGFDYLILLTGGIFFLVAINYFKGERFLEFIIILAFSCFYIFWGFYHHAINDSIYIKNVVEYILIAFIVLFLIKLILIP